ncbi:MAG: non-hydrolyzing UDP-N-acetylglucosamine 2-epimerase [Chloroflexota bacterium]
MKVLSVFGTRPEAIKMFPVVQRLQQHPAIESRVCVTAQHREMLDQVLSLVDIRPDYDLNVMQANQRLSYVTGQVLLEVEKILEKERPDWLLVQGDTTTVMAASLAAFYQGVAVGHVEAGLRTRDKRQPFPEEINRRIADNLADLHFAPTARAKENLLAEGTPESGIVVTGNTIVDALLYILARTDQPAAILPQEPASPDGRTILVTVHRRESFGEPLERVCQTIAQIARDYPSAHVLLPVHPNPNVRNVVRRVLGDLPNVTLTEPLDYVTFVRAMDRAYVILTDSGGVQEEATVLGKPVLVMRERTERTEALDVGVARLVGTDRQVIMDLVDRLMRDSSFYAQMSQKSQVYGDGHASERIVQALLDRPRS